MHTIKTISSIEEQSKEVLFTRLYLEVFPIVARYVARSKGDLDEARDIFQEAILVYYEKVVMGDFQPSNHKAYILGIAKNKWLKNQMKTNRVEPIDDLEIAEVIEEKLITEKLLVFLQEAGEKCMYLLQSFYYEKLSMQGLSERFGFGSERSATVQKYKCLEKVREEIKQKSLTYEDFLA